MLWEKISLSGGFNFTSLAFQHRYELRYRSLIVKKGGAEWRFNN